MELNYPRNTRILPTYYPHKDPISDTIKLQAVWRSSLMQFGKPNRQETQERRSLRETQKCRSTSLAEPAVGQKETIPAYLLPPSKQADARKKETENEMDTET